MSSQKGNVKKSGAQKYKNRSAFKNSLHDTSKRTQLINTISVGGVCARCKDIVEWKIKYKKYKPLSQPKTCVKCQQKTVRKAYYVVCQPCASGQRICAKCAQSTEIVLPPGLTPEEEAKQQSELNCELKQMSERKRRTFFRLQESGQLTGECAETEDGNSDLSNEESDDECENIEGIEVTKEKVVQFVESNKEQTVTEEKGCEVTKGKLVQFAESSSKQAVVQEKPNISQSGGNFSHTDQKEFTANDESRNVTPETSGSAINERLEQGDIEGENVSLEQDTVKTNDNRNNTLQQGTHAVEECNCNVDHSHCVNNNGCNNISQGMADVQLEKLL